MCIGGAAPYTGRGGWSWYTGAAAWSWRLAVENILGIRLIDGKIELAPCLPSDWASFRATVRGKGTVEISVERGREAVLAVDGELTLTTPIEFPGDGNLRRVELVLAEPQKERRLPDLVGPPSGSRADGA